MKKCILTMMALVLFSCNGNGQELENKKMTKLIYVMDPLCGWCYGNSNNTQKLYDKYKDTLDIEIIPAGMWAGENARKQSKPMAQFIKKHDSQVQKTTGTKFGKDYFDFIENESILLDSEVPSRAIVTIKKMNASKAIPFAIEVQKARYWFGKDLNIDATYVNICEKLALNKDEFLKLFHSVEIKKVTQENFVKAQQYVSSYPTLLAQKNEKTYILEQGYASYESIKNQIEELLN